MMASVLQVTNPAEPASSSSKSLSFADRHFAVIGAVSIVVLASIRVYAVSGFHLPTTLTILTVLDRTQLLASTLILALAGMIPLLLIALAAKWIDSPKIHTSKFGTLVGGAALIFSLFLFWAYTYPVWSVFVGFAAIFISLLTLYIVRHTRICKAPTAVPRQNIRSQIITAIIVGFLLATFLLAAAATPWLPEEAVDLQASVPQVGYVVGSQSNMTLILRSTDLEVVWVETESIEGRSTCAVTDVWRQGMVTLWFRATVKNYDPGVDCEAVIRERDQVLGGLGESRF